MRQLVEFPLADGGCVVVEVEVPAGQERVVRAARPGELAVKAGRTFEDALAQVRPMADAVLAKLRALAARPDEVEIEFGLKLSAEAGAILTSAGAEANFQVTLRWTREADAHANGGRASADRASADRASADRAPTTPPAATG
ncbi:MAG TPA: CU044_2847 family protein [Gemmatimonadaceae bacterium]|nr:CU044_2847 family protein [Gemmatimonadaceae bacterium]